MMTPPARPRQTEEETRRLLGTVTSPAAILGMRGYYSNTFAPAGNNVGVYDDALFVVSPNTHTSFNANVDPSRLKTGVARLKSGVWYYRLGTHNISKEKSRQYPALVQAAPVTVFRHEKGDDTGWFGINIHRGGNSTTSSLGCVTLPPSQWDAFYALVKVEMGRANLTNIPFVLIGQ